MTTVRILDRVVAGLLALALLVGGVVVAIEVALHAVGRDGPWVLPWDAWYREGVARPWSDAAVRAACIGLVVAGLLLLLLQLARRKPAAVALERQHDAIHVDLDRRGLEDWLSARLRAVEGVGSTNVRARRRTLKVSAQAVARDTAPIERRLEEEVKAQLDGLGLGKRPSVKVDVASRRTT